MKSAVASFILFSVVLCCTGSSLNRDWNFRRFSPMLLTSEVFQNATHCTPGTDFFLACNPCRCQKSGIKSGSTCRNKGCPPLPPIYHHSAKCTPGMKFMLDCNSCRCGTYGTVRGSACTKKGCTHIHP